MRFAVIVILTAIILVGAVYLVADYVYPYPEEIAEEYIEALIAQNFARLTALHHPDREQPAAVDISQSFQQFADSFALKEIELLDLQLHQEETGSPLGFSSGYKAAIRYSSEIFPAKEINLNIELSRNFALSRTGFFDWKVHWQDQLPLPEYGMKTNYGRSRLVPERGSIFDRNGELLAGGGSVINIGVQPGRIEDPELLFTTLEEELGLSEEYVRSEYEAPGVQDHWFVPITTITEQKYRELDPILRPVPGIFFRREESRTYPEAEITGHITGYLGEVTAEMIADFPELDYHPGELAGRSGLETGQEAALRGSPGYQFYVEGSRIAESDSEDSTADTSSVRKILAEVEPRDGSDIFTAIDLPMQKLALEILENNKGSLVILDANSGEILTLASYPGYDPNEFITGISASRWSELAEDPDRPLFNRAAQGRYPPGSTFKVLTAAAAIDQEYFTAESEFEDSGELIVEGNRIRNFEEGIFQEHTLEDAIVNSINTTMARVGLEIGADNLSEYFSRLELDRRPEISLPVQAGQLGNPEQSQVNLAWSAIGQAQVLITPLQMAKLFAVFANDGYLPELSITAEEFNQEQKRVFQQETIETLDLMLERVVTEGTGQQAVFTIPGDDNSETENSPKIYGKTGTAEVTGRTPHAWFAGYIRDLEGRDISFAVMLEHAGVGGRNAAPLIAEFFEKLLADEIIDELEPLDQLEEVEL